MADNLLPCPFCGGPARLFPFNGCAQATCAKEPNDCAGADGYSPVAMWNRRPAPTEADTSLQKVQTTPPDMEAVAWREKVARIVNPSAWQAYDDEVRDCKRWGIDLNPIPSAERFIGTGESLKRADAILQALAVIPTEGGEGRDAGGPGS